MLTPAHTLEEAKLEDGQLILLEMSLQDGTWPRSQMQSMLEGEEEEVQQGSVSPGTDWCIVLRAEPHWALRDGPVRFEMV